MAAYLFQKYQKQDWPKKEKKIWVKVLAPITCACTKLCAVLTKCMVFVPHIENSEYSWHFGKK